MSYSVLYTPRFEKELKRLTKKYPSLASEFRRLVDQLEENPETGTNLGHSVFKIRLAISSKGKGKSGGARVITFVKIQQSAVLLLTLFNKGEINTVSDKEIKELLHKYV
jgi:mRNA-degrading endonuclease RelE of RelBE toxin-antitoxin system